MIEDIDFTIRITIHSSDKINGYAELLEHLQLTSPTVSYTYCKTLYLLYNPRVKQPVLRSNISGDIISSLASEITKFLIVSSICDVYLVEVEINIQNHEQSVVQLLEQIKTDNYFGYMHGVDPLNDEKINTYIKYNLKI
jgi:hypothetical protein